jgi:hypothetical protein
LINSKLLLEYWYTLPTNSLKKDELFACPSYRASNQNWKKFNKALLQIAGCLLNLDLNEPWDSGDLNSALAYLEANQLFRECLQVARVENREAIEDMILKAPSPNDAPDGHPVRDKDE